MGAKCGVIFAINKRYRTTVLELPAITDLISLVDVLGIKILANSKISYVVIEYIPQA